MAVPKIFQLLDTLSAKEWREFRTFLNSPYHQLDSKLPTLLDALAPAFGKEGRASLDEPSVWQAAFPGQVPDVTQQRNIKTMMANALRAFVAHRKLKDDEGWMAQAMQSHLVERNAFHQFQQHWDKSERDFAATPHAARGPDTLLYHFQGALIQAEAKARAGVRTPDSFLQETMARLDSYYILQKLRLACAYLNQVAILGGTALVHGPDPAAYYATLPQVPWSQLSLYAHVHQMLREPEDPRYFTQLLVMLFHPCHWYPEAVFAECYSYAINHCVRLINQGRPGAKQQYLALFQRAKDRPGALVMLLGSPLQRKNLVQVAASEGAFDYAAEIADYSQHSHPQSAITNAFHQGVIQFYKGDLGAAAKRFKEVDDDGKDRFFRLDARVFLLLALYGQNDETCETIFDAFRMKLGREQLLSPAHKKKFGAFQNFFARLLRIQPNDRQRLAKLRANVEKGVAARQFLWVFDWLARLPPQKG
jgi:hypothetical protein